MGCLNSSSRFQHIFGNIHLSGPCNRRCYFCIGQHMMALDSLNVLDTYPFPGMREFLAACRDRGVREVNLTGSNIDPLLYCRIPDLTRALREALPGVELGVRTNAIGDWTKLGFFDKVSVSMTHHDPALYAATMGGTPPDLDALVRYCVLLPLKVNCVLCPETRADLPSFLDHCRDAGVQKVNLREPYGQAHQGDPELGVRVGSRFGMPLYEWAGMEVLYWDVHYVEVESVNLYANGRVSTAYSVTRGHDESGVVLDQSHFPGNLRRREQWVDF